MRLISEYSNFRAEYRPITLYIKGQSPIAFDVNKIKQKELLVRGILNEFYPKLRGNDYFNVEGVIVSGELLNKAQKNISILYEIVDIAKSTGVTVNSAEDIINFISDFKKDLFYVTGKFFYRIYKRLGGATEKGRTKENEANELFTRYANSKGIKVELKSPDSYKEDIAGIDAYFDYNGQKYTIQTKTLSSIRMEGEVFKIYISGDFTTIKTHYLVLVSELPIDTSRRLHKNYIFKGKNVKTEIDETGVNYYKVPVVDLLYKE